MKRKTRLGIRQLEALKAAGTDSAYISPTKITKRLCDRGLMQADDEGGWAHCTPDGLRALADAVNAGRIELFDFEGFKERLLELGG